MQRKQSYLMENEEEAIRLEIKTDAEEVRKQALWCGLRPGMRLLDVGCGPGKTTSILYEMMQPGGFAVGLDFSEQRISYAREHFGGKTGLDFVQGNLMNPPEDLGQFDFVWVRFVLEYYRKESPEIVRNLKKLLKPGGYLCLLDLDYNCLSHYELPPGMGELLLKIMTRLDEAYNFDTYAGRKLYSYLYDAGFEGIEVNMAPNQLIYGEISDIFMDNYVKKFQVNLVRLKDLLREYPKGQDGFISDFQAFLRDPRRFTYTPLMIAKGRKSQEDTATYP